MKFKAGQIWEGVCKPVGVRHRRRIVRVDGQWIEWEPVGYSPVGRFRRLKKYSFQTWSEILLAEPNASDQPRARET